MEFLLTIISVICFILGIAGCILPILPGPPLCYIGLLILYLCSLVDLSISAVIIWAIITIIVTIIDFFLTPYMSKKFGGTKAGNIGSIVGLIIGFFLPWPFGPIFGPFVGTLTCELLFSKQNSQNAMKSAIGALLSFFVGSGIKLIVCVLMIMNVIIQLF